jgi:hypothetical protein
MLPKMEGADDDIEDFEGFGEEGDEEDSDSDSD